MRWKMPPEVKIYEALGAVVDGRVVQRTINEGKVESSIGNKVYTVKYDGKKAIMTNDNGSYWQGYLGYPAIAFLMTQGIVGYHQSVAAALKGIEWKLINDQHQNDYNKTKAYALNWAEAHGVSRELVEGETLRLMTQVQELNLAS